MDSELEIKAYYAGHVLGAAMFQIKVGCESVVYTVSDLDETVTSLCDPFQPKLFVFCEVLLVRWNSLLTWAQYHHTVIPGLKDLQICNELI